MFERAKKLFRKFHGRPVNHIAEIEFNEPEHFVFLGRAVAVLYESDKINGHGEGGGGDLKTYIHEMPKENILCTDETGKQLYIFGPRMHINERGIIS